MGVLRRLLNVFRRSRLERDLDDELEFHREMRLRRASEQGLGPSEAKMETARRMGNLSVAKEEMRDARISFWLASSLQDLRHGFLLLWKDARLSALIIVVLALGIGGNTAIFTLMKAAYFDPLPYRNADRLITVTEEAGSNPRVSEFVEIRERSRTLEDAAYIEHRDMQVSGTSEPARVFAARVTASFFPLLGVNAVMGRTFLEEENQPGRDATVVVSNAFWRTKLGSDSGAVGRTLRLDGKSAQIVGVLPAEFHFDYPTLRIPEPVDIYVSLPVEPLPFYRSTVGMTRFLARLRDGVTNEEAQSDLKSIGLELVREHPESYVDRDGKPTLPVFRPVPLRDAIVGSQRSLFWLLLGSVAVLLLIACANTAQLLLARSLQRRREIAIRAALGASRLRLIRQFLLEGIVLAACGGAAGLLSAGWIARLLVNVIPRRSPLLESAHLDLPAVAFTLAISFVSAMVFTVIPALKGSSWTPGPDLNVRAAIGEGNRWRYMMIAVETALSVFLLCGAGLMVQNLWTLNSAPVGFDPAHLLVMQLKLPVLNSGGLNSSAIQPMQQYLDRIAAIPGVDSVATVTGPPLRPARGGPTELAGEMDETGKLRSIIADNHLVSPNYFRTLRIPLLAGRIFRNDDHDGRPSVAIVNEEFARQFGLGRNVVGKQIFEPVTPITIVGMVGNVRTRGLTVEAVPEVYLSSLQYAWANVYLVVRSAMTPAELLPQVKAAVVSANPDQAVFGVMTMDELLSDAVTEPRFNMFLIGAFALLSVVMAAAGTYSVIACLVSQRTNEIAVRLVLGATRADIVRTILAPTTAWMSAGLVLGLGLGLAVQNTVRALSNTVVAGAPWMYAAVMLFFFAVTVTAAYMPVRRASRIDPGAALRSE